MFVTCGIGRGDQFTGCAELRFDTCEYLYNDAMFLVQPKPAMPLFYLVTGKDLNK